jgi:signal transduction histidine kinase
MQSLQAFQCSLNPLLVLLSYSISVLGSLAALQWLQNLPRLRGRRLAAMIAGPAVALGGAGVWSMHFIAMTACRLPVPVSYDLALTAASLLLAVAVIGVGLYVVATDPASTARLLAGGIFAGAGIAAMHYTGMAAMRLPARITYRPILVVASCLIAIAAAMLAFWVGFQLRSRWQRFGSAFVMAGAICGLHYAAMTGTAFVPNYRAAAAAWPALGSEVIGFTVFWLTLLVLALVLMESRITDARQAEAELRESEARYRTAYQSAQALAGRLQAVREEESARIAREVHDEVGQALTALRMDLAWLQQKYASPSAPAAAGQLAPKLRSMGELLDAAMDAVQRIMSELRPAILDKIGLEAAIDWYVGEFQRRTGIACRFRSSLPGAAIDPERSTVLFRILQEALTNVARHAAATEIDVRLGIQDHRVVLEVADNGAGIPADRIGDPRSLGLLGMSERARALGGDVLVRRNPDRGTTVKASIPL